MQIVQEMALLQNQLDDLSKENTLVMLKPRNGSALTAKSEQIMHLTRAKTQIVHNIGVLQAEYLFHLTYEDDADSLDLHLPEDITPSEVEIFQAGAMSVIHDKSLSSKRKSAAEFFWDKFEEIKTIDPVLQQIERSTATKKKGSKKA